MITIKEKECVKLPGIHSLFVTFPFNKEIISIVRACDPHAYDVKSKTWEVPIYELSYLLDSLTPLDDINVILCNNSKNRDKRRFQRLNYKLNPFKYQNEGIEYGLNKEKWLLLDAPGLGKTAQIIHIAEELKEQEGLKHCLIICGVNGLKANWKLEIAKHSNLSYTVLGEKINKKGNTSYLPVNERAQLLKDNIDEFFIITNVESFRKKEMITAFESTINDIGMIVVDEIHKCKSESSKQGSNLLKLDSKYKIGATGTLLLNNALDAYLPLTWIGANKGNLHAFKKYYCIKKGDIIVGYKNLDILKEQISENSLRRTKDIISDELPPKNIIDEYIELEEDHKKLYRDVVKGIKEDIDKIKLNTANVLALTTRLRQVTSCPSVITTKNITSNKLLRAKDLAEDIVSNGDKVVIFCNFKESVLEMAKLLEQYSPIVITGDSKDDYIAINYQKFQTEEEPKILIATWQKMGTGFTLNKANYMIHIDTAWTWALYEQSCDRIHRIGSNKNNPVFIYNLICKDTIDEKVFEILRRKKAMGDYIIDDKLNDEEVEILKNYIADL